MGSLIAAYLGGWLAVSAYLGWLGVQNVRMARRLDELETLAKAQRELQRHRSKAA